MNLLWIFQKKFFQREPSSQAMFVRPMLRKRTAQFPMSVPNMSYDTTVHEALDPPQPRLSEGGADRQGTRRILRRMLTVWRPLAATSVTICTLFLVTWIVATLTHSAAVQRTDPPEREANPAEQDRVVRERSE